MDLIGRSVSDLRNIRRTTCSGAPKEQNRKRLIEAIKSCTADKNIRVVPCFAPRILNSEYKTLLLILESIHWDAFSKSKKSNDSRSIRGTSTDPGSANFVLGTTKGAAGSSGFHNFVEKLGKRQGYNYDIVKGRGLPQKQVLMELWETLKQLVKRVDPTYTFTSAQVNRNFGGRVHRDMGDKMHQYALSLGNFKGGELMMSTTDPFTYIKYNTRGRLTRCDGRHPHWVTSHTGEHRYSIILYNVTHRKRPRESNLDFKHHKCRRSVPFDKSCYPRGYVKGSL